MKQEVLEKALDLIVYDVDMSGINETIFEKVFGEICKNCDINKCCRDCIKSDYICKAEEKLND